MRIGHPNLENLRVGSSSRWWRERAWRHLGSCTSCRRRYEALAEAERAMAGDLDQPTAAEIDALERLVIDAVPSERPRRMALWLGVPAVAAAATMAVMLLVQPVGRDTTFDRDQKHHTRPDIPEEYVERRGEHVHRVGVRLFCHTPGRSSPTEPAGGCARGSTLVPAIHLPAAQPAVSHMWLEDAEGVRHVAAGASLQGAPLEARTDQQVPELYLDINAEVALGEALVVVVVCGDCSRRDALRVAAGDVSHDVAVHRSQVLVVEADR